MIIFQVFLALCIIISFVGRGAEAAETDEQEVFNAFFVKGATAAHFTRSVEREFTQRTSSSNWNGALPCFYGMNIDVKFDVNESWTFVIKKDDGTIRQTFNSIGTVQISTIAGEPLFEGIVKFTQSFRDEGGDAVFLSSSDHLPNVPKFFNENMEFLHHRIQYQENLLTVDFKAKDGVWTVVWTTRDEECSGNLTIPQ